MNFVTKILVLANWDPSNIEEGSQICGKGLSVKHLVVELLSYLSFLTFGSFLLPHFYDKI